MAQSNSRAHRRAIKHNKKRVFCHVKTPRGQKKGYTKPRALPLIFLDSDVHIAHGKPSLIDIILEGTR